LTPSNCASRAFSPDDEDTPVEVDEDTKRFAQLFCEEEERRKARLVKGDDIYG